MRSLLEPYQASQVMHGLVVIEARVKVGWQITILAAWNFNLISLSYLSYVGGPYMYRKACLQPTVTQNSYLVISATTMIAGMMMVMIKITITTIITIITTIAITTIITIITTITTITILTTISLIIIIIVTVIVAPLSVIR